MNGKTYPLNYLLDQIAEYIKSENAVASDIEKTRAKGITNLFHKLYAKIRLTLLNVPYARS